MRETPNLKGVSDDKLLRGLFEILKQTRHDEADLVAHIAEVDTRKLYAREAAPSMFAYCTEVLHLSEPEAALRIRVARASRRHPNGAGTDHRSATWRAYTGVAESHRS